MDNRVTILLVDDQPRNLDALEAILDTGEYRFARAQSADEALLALLQGEFAAIVLDIRMPGVSGLELATMIKRRKRTQHIPILFLTAHLVEEQDILQGYGVGAVDYLQKPVNPEILRSKVAVFADLFRKTRALAGANQALAAEITQRERAQEALSQANEALEARVVERTANLTLANQALRESEERFRTMAETVPDIIFTALPDGRCDYLNARFYEYTGMPTGSGDGAGWTAAVHADDLEQLLGAWRERVHTGQAFDIEYRMRSGSGAHRWFRSSVRPIRDPQNRVVKWFGSSTDIHDLKTSQEELSSHQARLEELVAERTQALILSQRRLAQQERLAALGTLATGLGHDMSNLLLPVRARLESLAAANLGVDETADVAAIREAAGYLQRLASALRLLAVDPERADEAEGATELSSWWRDVEGLFRAAAPRGVRLVGNCAPGLPPVGLSAARLTQTVFNLVQNAAEALTSAASTRASPVEFGSITINAALVEGPEHAAQQDQRPGSSRRASHAAGLSAVAITVTDDGPGMSPDVAARCFEPYFSTKVRAVSTGLGLPMVRAWVEAAGGTVTLKTAPGQGAAFSLVLPCAMVQRVVPGGAPAAARPQVAVTLTDPRIAGFLSAIIREAGAIDADWDGEGIPEADVWVVNGAAAVPERIAAFVAERTNRRAIVLTETGRIGAGGSTPESAAGPGAPAGADWQEEQRVWYTGRRPSIGVLRDVLLSSLRAVNAQGREPAPQLDSSAR